MTASDPKHWAVVTSEPEPVCGNQRGGSGRSNTFCEMPPDHKGPWHTGRSQSGRWFSWQTDHMGTELEVHRNGDVVTIMHPDVQNLDERTAVKIVGHP